VPVAVGEGNRGEEFLAALGGAANLKSVDACMTRLRLNLADPSAIDEPGLRALGVRGIVRPGGDSVQVVLGPIADQVAGEIRIAATGASEPRSEGLAQAIAGALEPAGIRSVGVCGSRLLIDLKNPTQISASPLDRLGTRGWVKVEGGVQIIIGADAEAVAEALLVSRGGDAVTRHRAVPPVGRHPAGDG
jgi:PTS system N-acetylglucosamine-specific IIC component